MAFLIRFCLVFLLSVWAATDVVAGDVKTIYLVDNQNNRVDIAKITFDDSSKETTYHIEMNETHFGDYFLSMRPFRCMEGERLVCRQPYPYTLKRVLHADDLRALEYDLLFISRLPSEYGIDPYNGRYYVLTKTDTGYRGIAHAVDLNILAAPPEEGITHPISRDDIDEMERQSVQFPVLIIE